MEKWKVRRFRIRKRQTLNGNRRKKEEKKQEEMTEEDKMERIEGKQSGGWAKKEATKLQMFQTNGVLVKIKML